MARPPGPGEAEPTRATPRGGIEGQRRASETAALAEQTLDLPPSRDGLPNPAQLRPGDVFAGRFEVVACVGRGGFSFVFKTRDRTNGETVALKFLAARDTGHDVVERMHRELRLARDLRHPSIVKVNELLEAEGYYCLAMEFVEGVTLKDAIRERRPLPVPEATAILLRLASAVAAVHAAGIVHRDLKPQNAIVTPDGNVKLLDFGLARTPDSTGLTASGTILGTPEYMSPEQVEGRQAQAPSDLYSLGVIAYELFTGEPPFKGDNALATALQHVRSRVPDPRKLRPDTPDALARLVLRMTEPLPSRRPASAQEVLVELSRLAERKGSAAAPRRKLLAAAAAVAGLALAGGIYWGTGARAAAARGGAGADPFADGIVDVAVVPGGGTALLGGAPFLTALADAVNGKLSGARTRPHTLRPEEARGAAGRPESLAASGVEQVLVLEVGREPGDSPDRFRIEGAVRSTRDGGTFRTLTPRRFRSLDFEAVDGMSQAVAGEYLGIVDAAFRAQAAKPAR